MRDDLPYRACPACDAQNSTRNGDYVAAPWDLAQCDDCGFMFLRNPPAYTALEEDLSWDKTYLAKREASKGSTPFSPLARRIRNGLGMYRDKTGAFRRWFNDGHVLDIGCGWGQRINPPMTPYGIEISVDLHRISDDLMRSRGGHCLLGAGAQAIWDFEPELFDGIVMFSYLEHETDVLGVLRGAHRALKPNGAVFIRVPNFGSLNRKVIGAKWCGFRTPDHVNYFTLDSLRDVSARAGFTLDLVNRVTLPIDDNVSVLLRKAGRGAQ